MALITISKVTRQFKMGDETIRALDGVSFEIQKGEFVSITGPSGCGKSTLMNLLGLLDVADSGSYLLNGKGVNDLTDDERAQMRNKEIGFVFQSFHLLPRVSALRNVEMPLVYAASYDNHYTKAKIREMALDALKKVQLEDRVEHAPNELSGGQRQRVAIARALVNLPNLILADEPTGNLDSKSGKEIMKLFQELHAKGSTIILVTHDPSVAAQTQRTIAMLDGMVKTDETH